MKTDHCRDMAQHVGKPGYICNTCAKQRGATWSKSYNATRYIGVCPDCGEYKHLTSVDDWNWLNGNQPKYSAGRN